MIHDAIRNLYKRTTKPHMALVKPPRRFSPNLAPGSLGQKDIFAHGRLNE